MPRFIFPLILSLILCGCASKIPYESSYPMTERYFHSRDGIFYGNIPTGWFSATDDTLGPSAVAWLLKEDFTVSITISEIKLNKFTIQQIEKEGLEFLAKLRAANYTGNTLPDKFDPICFKFRGKEFCGFNLFTDDENRRFVFYSAKGHFYECSTRQLKGKLNDSDTQTLFEIQQAILGSIGY
ncbi:MAG: hypothetical protein HY964_04025 [Ignavibacteriales bacterium]|nr:hypothetical protein [Ignavibacteriales bacterium]